MKINAISRVFFLVSFFITPFVCGQNKLIPQKATFDLPTAHTLSIVVPTLEGDVNRNGSVEVYYRESGKATAWKKSISLYRTNNGSGSHQPFAGMLFDLKANTEYEIKLIAKDPDGIEGAAEQIVKAKTKKIPARVKVTANAIEVSNYGELIKAIGEAVPGSMILLKKGTYKGNITVSKKVGTAEKPIVIRGKDRSECIIHGKFTIAASSFIHVENVTVMAGGTGFYLSKCDSLVIRDNAILKINNGVTAKGGHKNLYIVNNIFIGNNLFGDVSNATWNDEGIVLSGMGHELANNTLAGFGDSIGMTHRSSLPNRAIDMHHNLVLWGGDDGVEMDFTDRNIQAHHNLFTNTANGISCQMVFNGPGYVYKNVMYNLFRGPYKIKPERAPNDGLFIMNNTSIKSGISYRNFSAAVDGLFFVNNLFVGTKSKEVMMMGRYGAGISHMNMDYNAWSYDGQFSIAGYGNASNFKDWKSKHSQGNHDVLLEGQKIFNTLVLDFDKNNFYTWRYPYQDFSLDKNSKAIDAGLLIPSINDSFTGKAPDIGALELGEIAPVYGAFKDDVTPPSLPGNIVAKAVSTTQIDFTWDAAKDAESGIVYYVIYRDGKSVAIIMGSRSYSDTKLTESEEHTYDIVAVNGRILESKKTKSIKIASLADVVPPRVTFVNAMGANTEIAVSFSEIITKESAENIKNYSVDNGVTVEKAVLQKSKMKVILKTSVMKKGANYRLVVTSIMDEANKPNSIAKEVGNAFQFKELKTFIDFGTRKLGVKSFDKYIRDKYTNFIKVGPGGIGPVARSNRKGSNYQGVVSETPRAFVSGEVIFVKWYNNSKKPLTFTPRISFTRRGRVKKGTWFNMSAVTIAPNDSGMTMFAFSATTAGNYKTINVNCNVKTLAKELICSKIQIDVK